MTLDLLPEKQNCDYPKGLISIRDCVQSTQTSEGGAEEGLVAQMSNAKCLEQKHNLNTVQFYKMQVY